MNPDPFSPDEPQGRSARRNTLIVVVVALLVVVVLAVIFARSRDDSDGVAAPEPVPTVDEATPDPAAVAQPTTSPGPQQNVDHWHAVYGVYDCTQPGPDRYLPPFMSASNDTGIHSHGDGLIHIHPFFEMSARGNARLRHFFTEMGIEVTVDAIVLDDGRELRAGTECADGSGPATISILHWDTDADAMTPRQPLLSTADFDEIRFENDREVYIVAFSGAGFAPPLPPSERFDELDRVGPEIEFLDAPTPTPTPGPTALEIELLEQVLANYPDVVGTLVGSPPLVVLTGEVENRRELALLDRDVRAAGFDVSNQVSARDLDPPGGFTIMDLIDAQPELSTLKGLLEETGLSATLDDGEFTLFAPTNDAFAAMGADLDVLRDDPVALRALLQYHVLPGSASGDAVASMAELVTVSGQVIAVTVDGPRVLLNGTASVLVTDVSARNGVMHVIANVLRPPA